MNKGELIDAIAEKTEVSKKDADTVLTAILDSIVEAVSSGDKVSLGVHPSYAVSRNTQEFP